MKHRTTPAILLFALAQVGGAQGPTPLQPAGRLVRQPIWVTESDEPGAILGASVACAGDVNGDGFSDVVIGAPGFDLHRLDEGKVVVFHGSSHGLSESPAVSMYGESSQAHFGSLVSCAGDVDNDGFDDICVVAPDRRNEDGVWGGASFVYAGSSIGITPVPVWSIKGTRDGEFHEHVCRGVGDVNGDGYDDVVDCTPDYTEGLLQAQGRVRLHVGSPSGLSTSPAWTLVGQEANARCGSTFATGDFNGDGFIDIVLVTGYPQRELQLYLGDQNGFEQIPSWQLLSVGNWFLPFSAGDINADGHSDLVVTDANYYDGVPGTRGRVMIFLGTAGGLESTQDWEYQIPNLSGNPPVLSVASTGDTNGDGYKDLAIYTALHPELMFRMSFFLGSSNGLGGSPDSVLQTTARYASVLNAAGDTNGDGFADILIGAPSADNGHEAEGQAYIYSWTTGARRRDF